MEKAVIGLDIGTSSIKALLCTFDQQMIRLDREKISSYDNKICPKELLEKVTTILSRIIQKNPNFEIKAIGLSTIFPSFLALDKNDQPLTEISTWADNHAHSIIHEFKKSSQNLNEIHQKTGCPVHESYPLWKILWLQQNQPEIFSQTHKFISLPEYLTYQFTNQFLISKSIASTTGLYNLSLENWDHYLLRLTNLQPEDLSVCHENHHAVKISREFCSEINLNYQPLLVLGSGDGFLAHLGSGCQKNIMSSTIGSSSALRVTSNQPSTNNSLIWCYYFTQNKYLLGSAINAGGSTLDWFHQKIQKKEILTFEKSEAAVASKPIAGPFFLPFLDGERGPSYQQNMSASFFNLTAQDDTLTLYRSILEGIFFNLYSCYEVLIKEARKPSTIYASGGYVSYDSLLQMQADIFNQTISVPNIKEASAFGAALVALKSLGKITDFSEINIQIKKKFFPNPKIHKLYMERYQKYQQLCQLISKIN